MKRITAIFSMILAFVMLSSGAFAEPTTAWVIRLSDPALGSEGVTVTIDGLALQMALCETDDESMLQVVFDLFAKGKNTHSALMQIDADHIVMFLSGMSRAYSLNLDELEEVQAASDSPDIDEIIGLAEDWTLPGQLEATIQSHTGDFAISEPETRTDDNGVVLQYVTISGPMNPLVYDMLLLIENDELINNALAYVDPTLSMEGTAKEFADSGVEYILDGECGVDATGKITNMHFIISVFESPDTEAVNTIDATIFTNAADPENTVINEYITVYDAQGNIESTISYEILLGTGSISVAFDETTVYDNVYGNMYIALSDTLDTFELYMDGSSGIVTVNGRNEKTENSFDCTVDIAVDDEYSDMQLGVTIASRTVDGVTSFSGSLAADDSTGESVISVTGKCEPDAGAFECQLVTTSSYGEERIGVSLVPEAAKPGMDYTGRLVLDVYDGIEEATISTEVNIFTAQVDTDKFYIDPASAADILEMTDSELIAVINELDGIFQDIADTLMEAYPAFRYAF